jgi:hypothetical protein
VSVYYWQRAIAAVERRRVDLSYREIPEYEDDPVWREIEHLAWLEQFAQTALRAADEAEIF